MSRAKKRGAIALENGVAVPGRNYVVVGPLTPGAPPSRLGPYAELETARRVAAERFDHRRDLRLESARIETVEGDRVEWAGPAR